MLDAYVIEYQGHRILKAKFKEQVIRSSPFQFKSINFKYNLNKDPFKEKQEKYFTKIANLDEPPY